MLRLLLLVGIAFFPGSGEASCYSASVALGSLNTFCSCSTPFLPGNTCWIHQCPEARCSGPFEKCKSNTCKGYELQGIFQDKSFQAHVTGSPDNDIVIAIGNINENAAKTAQSFIVSGPKGKVLKLHTNEKSLGLFTNLTTFALTNIDFQDFLKHDKREWPPKIEKLNLENCGLNRTKEVKSFVEETQVSELSIPRNDFQDFPSDLLQVETLKQIDFGEWEAKKIDKEDRKLLETYSSKAKLRLTNCSPEDEAEKALRDYCDSEATEDAAGEADEERPAADTQASSNDGMVLYYILIPVACVAFFALLFIGVRYKNKNKPLLASELPIEDPDSHFETLINSQHTSPSNDHLVFIEAEKPTSAKSTACDRELEQLADIRISLDNVLAGEKLRVVGYEQCCRGKLKNENSRVLIKRLDTSSSDEQVQKFADDIHKLATIAHPNITRIHGAAWSSLHDMTLVAPLSDQERSLSNYLENGTPLSYDEKLKILVGIAEALRYLDNLYPPVFYHPLVPANVFLDANNTPKLDILLCYMPGSADAQMQTLKLGAGIISSCAPELLLQQTFQEDSVTVYAFGVLMCHVLSEDGCLRLNTTEKGTTFAELELMERIINGDAVPSPDPDCPQDIVEVISQCVARDPAQRLNWTKVCECLEKIQQATTEI